MKDFLLTIVVITLVKREPGQFQFLLNLPKDVLFLILNQYFSDMMVPLGKPRSHLFRGYHLFFKQKEKLLAGIKKRDKIQVRIADDVARDRIELIPQSALEEATARKRKPS